MKINIYLLTIKDNQLTSKKEQILEYLSTWNGEPGYKQLAENITESESYGIIGTFTLDYLNNVEKFKGLCVALVLEDLNGNVMEYLYNDNSYTLKWGN